MPKYTKKKGKDIAIAKLDDYTWMKLPPDLIEWLQDCTDIINLGKYSMREMASPPTSATLGYNAEFGIAKDGATWYMYIYTGSADGWLKVALCAL